MNRSIAFVALLILVLALPVDTHAGFDFLTKLRFWDQKTPTVLVITNGRDYSVDVFVNTVRVAERLRPGGIVAVTFNDVFGWIEKEKDWAPQDGSVVHFVISVGYVAPGAQYRTERYPNVVPIAKAPYVKTAVLKLREIR